MSKRITTCFGCHYFRQKHYMTGKMWCGNSARTWANELPEDLEEIQVDCKYWTEPVKIIRPKQEDEQMTIDLRLYL